MDHQEKFFASVDQRKLELMISARLKALPFSVSFEVKNLGKSRSAKALHFTREQNTIEAAETWLAENQGLPDLEPRKT